MVYVWVLYPISLCVSFQQQVTDLSAQLESAQTGTSNAIVVTKEAEGIPTPLLFDVVQDSLLVAVEVVKTEGSVGLVLTDTKQQVAGRRQATVTVKSVAQGSPADEAGLRAGDQVRTGCLLGGEHAFASKIDNRLSLRALFGK